MTTKPDPQHPTVERLTPAAPPPELDLEAAERDLSELEHDLAALREALSEHELELTTARRAGQTPTNLATLGTRAASLRLLVADQAADVDAARATVERQRAERERAAREATLKATTARLATLQTEYGAALATATLAVRTAFDPVRAARARWLAAREHVHGQVLALGVPLDGGGQDATRRTLGALDALGLDHRALFAVPDEIAPRIVPSFDRPAHFPLPEHLLEHARSLGLTTNGHDVLAAAFLRMAADAAAHPFREAPEA